jgi:hypothetical protein
MGFLVSVFLFKKCLPTGDPADGRRNGMAISPLAIEIGSL